MLDARETRLGDIIDDFCVKCKRIMNHAVVSTLEGQPAKVRCRTCYNDHDYRHELAPPPKVDPRKAALAQELLAKESGETSDSVVSEGEAEGVQDATPTVAKSKGKKAK